MLLHLGYQPRQPQGILSLWLLPGYCCSALSHPSYSSSVASLLAWPMNLGPSSGWSFLSGFLEFFELDGAFGAAMGNVGGCLLEDSGEGLATQTPSY